MKPIRFFIIGGTLLCSAFGVLAQDPGVPADPPSVALSAAVEAAWQRAAAASEAEGQRKVAAAGVSAAGRLWAAPPALELSHRNDRLHDNRGERETEYALAWPLWMPGQRSAHLAAAEADVEVADAAAALARLRVAGEVREAAWRLVAQKTESALARGHAEALALLAQDVERRVAAGDLAQTDALAARAEWLDAQAAAQAAAQDEEDAAAQWRTLTGLPPAVMPDEGEREAAGTEHPELRWARMAVERASRQRDEARLSRRDPPELTLGLREERGGDGAGVNRSVGVALRVPFGTDDRNLVGDAKVLAELETARVAAQRAEERLSIELERSRRALASTQSRVDAARLAADAARERLVLLERAFSAGELALSELLRARIASARAESTHHRLQAERGLAHARHLQASGILP